ncbi:MAG: DUF4062 domain-containing protein [Treponema sp.]|nr:DUF4062 domain-containing protein [Treponema sp.]
MSKKYLVFISSTQDDLKAERRELTKIVTELGAIPVTLDAFDIASEEDRKLIHKAIGECDYFLNLTAYKGGGAAEKSFALELEYSYAVKAEVPVLALIIGEKARWKASKKEKNAAAAKALEAFKKKLEGHTHETWTSLADLRQKAMALLSREMNLNPRGGWVPSVLAVDPSVANELCRLLRENESLRSQIRLQDNEIVKSVREQIRHVLKVLAANRISLSFYYTEGENWENTQSFRYLRLFRLLAPELSTPKNVADITRFLGNILNPDLAKTVRKDYPTPSNTIKKIMADFTLLKLVRCTGSGDDEAWGMTEYGREAYAVYRLRQMNSKLPAKP